MKILVTAFEPFGGEKINPTMEVLKQLKDEILGVKIIKLEIPTVQNKSFYRIQECVEDKKPDVILSLGQASGRADISVERIAINVDDYNITDNEGNQPLDKVIVQNAPDAYFLNIPIKDITKKIKENGIPASISNSAGTFVCNHVAYKVAHFVSSVSGSKIFPKMRSGFIHIPLLPEQAIEKNNKPTMSLENMTKAIELGIEAIIENDNI